MVRVVFRFMITSLTLETPHHFHDSARSFSFSIYHTQTITNQRDHDQHKHTIHVRVKVETAGLDDTPPDRTLCRTTAGFGVVAVVFVGCGLFTDFEK